MKTLRVELSDALAYWTVVDDDWVPAPAADAYLRHLRLGADRAEGTTRVYAGDLALFLGWCAARGCDLLVGAKDLHLFVGVLKTTTVERPGAGRGKVLTQLLADRARLAAVPELAEWARRDAAPSDAQINSVRRLLAANAEVLAGLDDDARNPHLKLHGDLQITRDTLHVRLDPPSAPRRSKALAALCTPS